MFHEKNNQICLFWGYILSEMRLCIVKFSDSLEELRRKHNLTQTELASKLFLSRNVIAEYNF